MRIVGMLCAVIALALVPALTQAKNTPFWKRGLTKEKVEQLTNRRSQKTKNQREKKQKISQSTPQVETGDQRDESKQGKTALLLDPGFQPKPDLALVYVIDEGNTAKIFIQNRGKRRSESTTVKLIISSLDSLKAKSRQYDIGPLDPLATKFVHVRGYTLSNVLLQAMVDPDNRVQESDENNNLASHKVEDKLTDAADLAITKMQFFPDEKQVWVTIHNYGRSSVGQAALRLNGKFGLSQAEKMRHTVKNLKPGAFQVFRFFPKQMNRGTQFEALVDPSNLVTETNERNNRLLKTF